MSIKGAKIDGAIVTTTTNNNYGNVVQRYALQRFLEKSGYNFTSYYFYGFYWRVFFIRQSVFTYVLRVIAGKLLKKKHQGSGGVYNYHALSVFCKERIKQTLFTPWNKRRFSAYIIGSDQNLGLPIKNEFFNRWQEFLLRFVQWDAKKISYASSFGVAKLKKSNDFIKSEEAKDLMRQFNAIGIREESGVKLAKEIWGVEARQVVDPTLLLDKSDYNSLIDNPTTELYDTKPVFYYLLRVKKDNELFSITQRIANDLGLDMDGSLTYDTRRLIPVEQWLQGYRDSEFVVTNSFHGVIFSLIYNTDFIVLCNRQEENSAIRFQDILGRVGLVDRIVFDDEFSGFDVKKMQKIDWSTVNERLSALREDSAQWLLEQLEG